VTMKNDNAGMNNVDRLLYFIVGYYQVHGEMPTQRTVIDALGFRSPATLRSCWNTLQRTYPDYVKSAALPVSA